MEWANLIVPSVISIVGFIVTYLSMCKQFKDSIKQQLTEEQRKVYLDTYIDVEKIVTSNGTLVPDRASSKGCTIRQVEILSNKLLTTAFEASLECVTVM